METIENIQYYRYRTAWAKNYFLEIPRNWVKELEEELCKKVGVRPDNHTTFRFKFNPNGGFFGFSVNGKYLWGEIVVTFHDGNAYFSREIDIRNW